MVLFGDKRSASADRRTRNCRLDVQSRDRTSVVESPVDSGQGQSAVPLVSVSGRLVHSPLLRLSSLFKTCDVWTLSCDFAPHSEINIKMALIAAHLDTNIILVVTV